MLEIKLSQGKVALVDDEYAWLDEVKWQCVLGYASHAFRDGDKIKHLKMHRVILADIVGRELKRLDWCDHINHDKLDNRGNNLRLSSPTENLRNRMKHIKTTSPYKGASWDKTYSKWQGRIYVNHKSVFLGYFLKEVDAALAYDRAAVKYFGEFAHLNFPDTVDVL